MFTAASGGALLNYQCGPFAILDPKKSKNQAAWGWALALTENKGPEESVALRTVPVLQ
jgi:hypothetical protein